MAQMAANPVEHVLPRAVPLRQWVITFPLSLRSRLAYDGELLGAVGHLFADSVLGFYRRRMALEGSARGRSGVINVMRRTSSDRGTRFRCCGGCAPPCLRRSATQSVTCDHTPVALGRLQTPLRLVAKKYVGATPPVLVIAVTTSVAATPFRPQIAQLLPLLVER